MRTAEPFKIKMVEPLRMISREERVAALKEAGYNPFSLRSEDVYIDLITDSGTGAMSDAQWAAMMMGDEAYAGSKSFYRLLDSAQNVFGYKYFIPTHQGRGAEQVLFPHFIKKKGQYMLGNMHFDTTKAHIELIGGRAVNFVDDSAFDTTAYADFKGNFDLQKLENFIIKEGKENIAGIIVTITCNSAGGQPVSMENIKLVSNIAVKYGLKVIMDSARFAENAYFIQQREKGYSNKSIRDIIREMFSYGDALTISAKKDGLVNIGGLIGVKEDVALYTASRSTVVPYEGFPTYGGMAGRDMDALAVGLQEVVEDSYLEYRIEQIKYLGDQLAAAGVPIQTPTGGHAVFVDCKKICPHIPFYQFPAQAVCNEVYLNSGVRAVEIGSFLLGRDPDTGEHLESPLELMRLTIPRRVYTNRHMDVIADAVIEAAKNADRLAGFDFEYEPEVLRHFTARLKPITG